MRFFLLISLYLFSQVAYALSYTLEVTEQELQEKIATMMPIERTQFLITVTLTDPAIELIQESGEIGVFINVKVSAPGGIYGQGRGKVVGTLSYEAAKGAFYFKRPRITHLELDQVPKVYTKNIQQIAQLTAAQALSVFPVYVLNEEELPQRLAKSRLESVQVVGKSLEVVLRLF